MRLASLAFVLAWPAVTRAQAVDSRLCDRLTNKTVAAEDRALAERVIAANAAAAPAAFYRGCLAFGARGASAAADEFERATKLDPSHGVYFDWLGRAYGDQAQHANVFRQAMLARRTKTAFERAVQLDGDDLDARYYLAQYYLLAPGVMGGSAEKAREQIEEIRRRNPYRGGLLAAATAQRDKHDAVAEREFESLVATYPDSTAPYYPLFTLYVGAKRYDDAARLTDRLVKAQPSSAVPTYLVGRLAAESGRDLDRGEAALKHYLTTAPKPGEPQLAGAHWRLGQIHERRGVRDSARTEYQTALRLDPTLKAARDALARLP